MLLAQFWENYGTVCTQIPLLLSHRPKVQKSSLKFWLCDVGHFSIGQMTRVPVRYYNISPPSPTCPALHSVLHFVLLRSFRGCTCGFGTICKSVPVVSHKFKSGLTVSKEMGLSAMEVCPRSYFKDCGSHSAVTGLNANFSFRQVTSFRPSVNASTTCEWAAIVARSVHWGQPVIHFTDIAFKHDVHISF